jgi:hypothetical protein
MSDHEYFQELSALSAIGQLSAEEDRELAEHLKECERCGGVHLSFARLVQQLLPQTDATPRRKKSTVPVPALDADVRARFLARARVDGIDFPPDSERAHSSGSSFFWQALQLRPVRAIAPIAVVAILVLWVGQTYQLVPRVTTAPVESRSTLVVHDNDDTREPSGTLHQTIEEDTARIELLKKKNAESIRSLQRLQTQLDDSQRQAEKLSADLQQTESEKSELVKASQEDHATIANLRSQSDSFDHERASMLRSQSVFEEQVRNLTASLQEKTADLNHELQLKAVNMNVSQLMGSRNLHIMDVHKVGENGKAAKAYGRIFYVEGQSLVFYAFDLPGGGLNPSNYTFQGWGRREPERQSVRNLGTFEADDHEQHRWVLKVNDPSLLTGIDSVFVTSESLRDSKQPRGRELMFANIAGQPNHP